MTVVDHPVHLSRSAPFEVGSGQLIFHDVIDDGAVSRCSVLSCLATSDGGAKLPDSVTVSDFRTWLSATDNHAKLSRKSFLDMCIAIKVGDVLDDKHINQLIHVAGGKLLEAARWSFSKECNHDVLDGLSTLNDNLQQEIFAVAGDDPQHLECLLSFLPVHLHQSILAGVIMPGRELRMPINDTSTPALKALLSLPAVPASLLSLHVDHNNSQQPRHAQTEDQSEMISYLTEALQHHTGLTSLVLTALSSIATSLRCLLPQIAKLTHLQYLDLEGFCSIPTARVPALKETLHSLPDLKHVNLLLSNDSPAAAMDKHGGENGTTTSQCCLADMLSRLTAITYISLRISGDTASRPHGNYFTAVTPFSLPHLVQLTACFDDNISLTASFVACLDAPLTTLKLAEDFLQSQCTTDAQEQATAAPQLICSLAAFPQLVSFSAALPADAQDQGGIFEAVGTAAPALQHLQELTVFAAPAVAHCILQVMAKDLKQDCLTHLRLGFCPSSLRMLGFQGMFAIAFFQTLHNFDLQHLDLEWEDRGPGRVGIEVLEPFTQLTSLRLKGWNCLQSADDWNLLRCTTHLQALRELCLDDSAELQLRIDCITRLGALTSLTSLTLRTAAVEFDVPDLEADVPQELLPELQELAVTLHDPVDARELTKYTAAMPALRRLTVQFVLPPLKDDHECDWEADRRAKLADRFNSAQSCLKEAAASAGVELLVVGDDLHSNL